jgi:hypothetical protein
MYIKIPQVVEFADFSLSGANILFRTGMIKSRQSRKIRMGGSPSIISLSELFRVTGNWL